MSEVEQSVDSVKEQARLLYFKFYSIGRIASELDLEEERIRNWIYGRRDLGAKTPQEETWRWQRKQAEADLVQDYVSSNSGKLTSIAKLSLDLIERALLARSARGPLSIQEAKSLADIVTSLDKLLRLDLVTNDSGSLATTGAEREQGTRITSDEWMAELKAIRLKAVPKAIEEVKA